MAFYGILPCKPNHFVGIKVDVVGDTLHLNGWLHGMSRTGDRWSKWMNPTIRCFCCGHLSRWVECFEFSHVCLGKNHGSFDGFPFRHDGLPPVIMIFHDFHGLFHDQASTSMETPISGNSSRLWWSHPPCGSSMVFPMAGQFWSGKLGRCTRSQPITDRVLKMLFPFLIWPRCVVSALIYRRWCTLCTCLLRSCLLYDLAVKVHRDSPVRYVKDGGFLKYSPVVIIHFERWDFPLHKPSIWVSGSEW